MPHHGSLDNSERLRITSLVNMSAEEDPFDLYAPASYFVDEARSQGLEADMCKNMLTIYKGV